MWQLDPAGYVVIGVHSRAGTVVSVGVPWCTLRQLLCGSAPQLAILCELLESISVDVEMVSTGDGSSGTRGRTSGCSVDQNDVPL